MKRSFLIACAILFGLGQFVNAQCTDFAAHPIAGDLTPTGVGGANTNSVNNASGGEGYTMTVCAGAEYTISTCSGVSSGSSWDTQLTVLDIFGNVLAYDDDGCSSPNTLHSTVTFTATFSGTAYIFLDQYISGTSCNSNTFANMILEVTQDNACGTNLPSTGLIGNSNCSNTVSVACGDIFTHTTLGGGDDASSHSCHVDGGGIPLTTDGEDVYYAVTVPASATTLNVSISNVIDDNDGLLELIFLGSTCTAGSCSASEQLDIASGTFANGTNTAIFTTIGPGTFYFAVDAQNDGIYSYDIEFNCIGSGIVFDESGCGNDGDSDGVYSTVNGSSILDVTQCNSYTFCHELYIENPSNFEWLKTVQLNLGSCYTNVTNISLTNTTASIPGTDDNSSDASNFYISDYLGAGPNDGTWAAVYDGATNSITWDFTDENGSGWGDGYDIAYGCHVYSFCFDAEISGSCALAADLDIGIAATDDGIGTAVTVASTDIVTATGYNLVNETIAPVITCPPNQTASLDGNCEYTIPDFTGLGSATDCDPNVTITQSPAIGTLIQGDSTVTITLTATDASGNTDNCTFDVVISDDTDPVAVCQNVTVNLDASGNGTLTTAMVDNGSSDNCGGTAGIASYNINQSNFDCTDIGSNPHTVTLTVTDDSGNTGQCISNITVVDGISPTATCQDITIQLDASGNATITGSDIDNGSNDACGIASLIPSQTNFNCSNIGINNIELIVTDNNGNQSSCFSDVTVEDNIAPTATCQNVTVNLDASGNAAISAADINNGSSDACGIASLSLSQTTFDCSHLLTNPNPVTLTVLDNNGNSSTCSATVTIEDNIAPTALCQDITVQLDASGNVTVTPADIDNNSSDNCAVSSMTIDGGASVTYTCANLGVNMNVPFEVFDASGNSNICTVDITVEDNIPPTFTTCIGDQNVTANANCDFVMADYTSSVVASDNCSLTLTQTPAAGVTVSGTQAVVITAADPAGNTATCNFNVIVTDNTPPTAICGTANIFLDASGNANLTAAMINNGSTDNCAITTYTASQTAFTCADLGSNNITLEVADGNGNTDTCTAIVTVTDNIAPNAVCQNITIQLDANGNATITPADVDGGSNDNCSIDNMTINGLTSISFDCNDIGTNNVNLAVSDASGGNDNCNAIVTIEDNVNPTVICQNISVNLDATGNVSVTAAQIDNGSNDACGIASLTVSPSSFDCSNLGLNMVTLIATDANGNIDSCSATVTVNDPNTPTANAGSNDVICADGTYTLSGSVGGSATTLTWTTSGDGSFDDNTLAGATYTPGPNDITNGTVDLTITSNLAPCSDASATMTLTIDPLPTFTVVSPGNNPSACGNSDGSIDITGLTSGNTYTLTYFDGTATQTITPITGVTSYNVSGLSAGGYSTFTITDLGTGCSTTDPSSVALSDPSAPTFTVGNQFDPTTCGGNDGSITISGLNNALSYDISYEDGSATVTSFTGVSPNASGDYVILNLPADTYTNFVVTVSGCTSSDGSSITLNDPSAPIFTVGNETNPTSCGGNEGTITISGLNNALTYDITYDDGSVQTITSVTASSGNYVITGLTAGSYSNFTVTNTATGCTGSDNSSITLVDPNGPVFTVGNESNPASCGGTEGTITLSGLNDALTYNITYDDGATQSITGIISTGGDYVMTGLSAGSYNNFTVVDAATGCSGNVTTTITLVDPNAPNFLTGNGLDPTSCGGADGSITITGLTDGLSYDITYDNGTVQTLNGIGSTGGSYVITGLASGSYTNFTVTLSGCTGNDTQIITLTDPAAPSAPVAGFDATYCEGDAIVDLNAAGTGGTLNWYDGTGTNIGTGGVLTPAGTVGTSQYFVDETINGCTGNQTLITITINPLPAAPMAGPDAVYCDGDVMADLTATAALGGTLDWSDGTSSIGSGATLTPSSSVGTSIYYVTETANGCLGTADSVIITVNPIPTAPVVSGDVIYCLGNTIADITATPSEGGTLNWFDDATLTNQIDTGMTYTPNVSAIGFYTYYVTEDAQGCISTSSEVTIEIEQCIVLEVEIPTGFTPDGDGVNDTWELPNLGTLYPEAIVKVFNRWGSLIFESEAGYPTPWDGTFKGEILPSESFYFIIDFKDTVDSREPATGPLTIIRK